MIVDMILDRKEGIPYNAHQFYTDCMSYGGIGDEITYAMDFGTSKQVQDALCQYITEQEYNPDICVYIRSVDWLEDDKLNPMCANCKRRCCGDCHGITDMSYTDCTGYTGLH